MRIGGTQVVKKTIRVTCHSIIALSPHVRVAWVDVWLTLKVRRKVVRLAPCVCGTLGVDADGLPTEPGVEEWEMLPALWEGARMDGIEELVYNKPEVNRSDVERALTLYLQQRGILKSEPRFQWKKPDAVAFAVPCRG